MNTSLLAPVLFWVKIGLLMTAIAWVTLVWTADPSEYVKPQQDSEGVKAAAFAIGAAMSLFIPFFRLSGLLTTSAIDDLARLVGAIAALLAGWYWLDSSINGPMAPFLKPMIAAVSVLTVMGLGVPAWSSLREWWRERRGRCDSESKEEENQR